MFEKEILKILQKEVKDAKIEIPPDSKLGDYAFPCFQLAKKKKKNPAEIAKDIASKLKPTKNVDKITSTGPYVNFFLNKTAVAEKVLLQVHYEKEKFGSSTSGKGKTVVVEYSSPNIGKPLAIWHLRSTMIGNSLYRLHKFSGYKTIGVNFLGDWGTQFGQLIYAHETWGDRAKLKKDATKYLVDIYVKFHKEKEKTPELQDKAKEWFKKLEENNTEAIKLWSIFKDETLKQFKKMYSLLGVEFDDYNGESFYRSHVDMAIKMAKKAAVESEGALVIEMPGDSPPMMLRKSDGTTTYAARDLSQGIHYLKVYNPAKVLNVVDVRQSLHFDQLYHALEKVTGKKIFEHVKFGLLKFKDVGTMGTRKGELIYMEDVLNKAIKLAGKIIEQKNPKLKSKKKIAEIIGVGAVVFGDLANDRIKDFIFDWDKVLDFEGDTAPYLQYTHARACSIVKKAKESKLKVDKKADFSLLGQPAEGALVMMLMKFPSVVLEATQNLRPHIVAQYSLQLGRAFNEFYHKSPVVQEENKKVAQARLLLVDCARQVLENSLGLLGITAPKEM